MSGTQKPYSKSRSDRTELNEVLKKIRAFFPDSKTTYALCQELYQDSHQDSGGILLEVQEAEILTAHQVGRLQGWIVGLSGPDGIKKHLDRALGRARKGLPVRRNKHSNNLKPNRSKSTSNGDGITSVLGRGVRRKGTFRVESGSGRIGHDLVRQVQLQVERSTTRLLSMQKIGGWGFKVGSLPDPWTTGEVVYALSLAMPLLSKPHSKLVDHAISDAALFLSSTQVWGTQSQNRIVDDGAFRAQSREFGLDVAGTAWVALALQESPPTPTSTEIVNGAVRWLSSVQFEQDRGDVVPLNSESIGSWPDYIRYGHVKRIDAPYATAYALKALSRHKFDEAIQHGLRTAISSGAVYLERIRNKGGDLGEGWGQSRGAQSDVLFTNYVLDGLFQTRVGGSRSLPDEITKPISWLESDLDKYSPRNGKAGEWDKTEVLSYVVSNFLKIEKDPHSFGITKLVGQLLKGSGSLGLWAHYVTEPPEDLTKGTIWETAGALRTLSEYLKGCL